MYGNPDWETAVKRLTAFWHKEIIDRPCLQIFTYGDYASPTDTKDVLPKNYWTDPLAFLQKNRRYYKNTGYYGEALPVLYPNAEHVAYAMGSELEYAPETIWIKKSTREISELDFSHVTINHETIRQMAYYFECLCEFARGECFIGFPHMGNAGDTLARMRGYENLCLDLYDNPKKCFALEDQILRIWKMCYDLLHKIINRAMPGSCGWLPVWHPGRCALIEFDFCALISQKHFKRYIPYLIERADYAENAIYHLDGPNALRHLDAILAIEQIGFIQWEPGAGSKDILEWIPVMQKIQAAKKGLYVSGGPHGIGKTKILLHELKPEGLMIPVYAENAGQAEQLLAYAAKTLK
jgi:hypothetical protein